MPCLKVGEMKFCQICGTENVPIASGSFSLSGVQNSPSINVSNCLFPYMGGNYNSSQQCESTLHYIDPSQHLEAHLQDAYKYLRLMKDEYNHLTEQDKEFTNAVLNNLLTDRQLSSSLALLKRLTKSARPRSSSTHVEIAYDRKVKYLGSLKARCIYLRNYKHHLVTTSAVLKERKQILEEQCRTSKKFLFALQSKDAVKRNVYCNITHKAQTMERMRLRLIQKLFEMIPIHVSGPKRNMNPTSISLSGCSTIMSLPLPNNGNFEDIPVVVITVALGYIAQILDSIASTINVALPHPLCPFRLNGISTISPQFAEDAKAYGLCPLVAHNNREEFRGFNWLSASSSSLVTHQINDGRPLKKSCNDESLRVEAIEFNPDFQKSLMLLQANIVSLCGKFGLIPSALWPSEALLLNLKLIEENVKSWLVLADCIENDHKSNSFDPSCIDSISLGLIKRKLCLRSSSINLSPNKHESLETINGNPLKDQETDVVSKNGISGRPDTEDGEWALVERGFT